MADLANPTGRVATYSQLPADAAIGDVYVCDDNSEGFKWNGSTWDFLGVSSAEVQTQTQTQAVPAPSRPEIKATRAAAESPGVLHEAGEPIAPETPISAIIGEVWSQIDPTLGTPELKWSGWNEVTGFFPNAERESDRTTAYVKFRFEARAFEPSYIRP